MNINKKIIVRVTHLVCMVYSVSIAAMYMRDPYDPLIRPFFYEDKNFEFFITAQGGIKGKAYSEEGASNALRIWEPDQDALAMLKGFSPLSPIGMRGTLVDATDDGVRGHFIPSGSIRLLHAETIAARARFYEDWTIGLYVPFYATELSDVCWADLTKSDNSEDLRVKQYLTKNFFETVRTLGDGLDLGPWSRAGLGDMTFFVEWAHNFPQTKPFLKNVRLGGRLGLQIPTGKHEDIDKIEAFAFGNDGAWGLPFALSLDLSLSEHMRAGVDVQLTHIFGHAKTRRIKTDVAQTDLLLLQKALVYKDYGLEQRFNMYVQAYRFYGFSALVGYQFFKHGEDVYAIVGNCFSSAIANTAERLQDYTTHHIVTSLKYAYFDYERVIPQVELFAQIPVKGKRALATTTLGCVISCDF